MPEEIMVIVIIAILAGTVTSMTKLILAHRERTAGVKKSDTAGSSMTTSELEGMLHRAVRKATDPLSERLGAVEERLERSGQAALPPKAERIELDEEHEAPESAMAPSRRRTH